MRRALTLLKGKHNGRRTTRNLARANAMRNQQTAQAFEDNHMVGEGAMAAPQRIATRGQQKYETNLVRGGEIAQEVKHMSDHEWSVVPMKDKHNFVKFVAKELRERPTQVTEQQKRRYYEQTMADPTRLDPNETVTDVYERIKLGLPVHIRDQQRSMGVTDAMYEAGEADLFDPDNAYKLENAMTHTKQLFVDYIRKKREGRSTEAERRNLANVSAELNYQTQKHMAHMFKYAGKRIQEVVKEERSRQLQRIEEARRQIQAEKQQAKEATASATEDEKEARALRRKKRRELKRANVERKLRETYGLDINVASAVWKQMKAHEDFLSLCEVITRMTKGTGFSHSADDESLDQYTEELRKVYSADPEALANVDSVRYMAAVDGVAPGDWSKRWFEKSLLLPLQQTPEYQELLRIQEEDAEAISRAAKNLPESSAAAAASASANEQTQQLTSGEGPSNSPAAQVEYLKNAVGVKQERAVKLVEKMFVPPTDERLETLHEKRLRYVAYLHMESQIARMRKNAKIFEGAEHSPEAFEARELYEKVQLLREQKAADSPEENPFDDAQIQQLFSEIRNLAKQFIARMREGELRDGKMKRVERLAGAMKEGQDGLKTELLKVERQRKRALVLRMLQILEKDVREDMVWAENMEEAERPPLLPIPEPMSYVSAADVSSWKSIREEDEKEAGNPFKKKRTFEANFLGQPWKLPNKPIIFWGTGNTAVKQALRHAAQDAERRRTGEELAPPYPCPENPWGWRLNRDELDDME